MANIRAVVYNNLATMLEAGVPIRKSMQTAILASRGRLRRAWQDVDEAVRQGDSLSQEMRKHPREFALLDVMLTEAGEHSGNLPQAMKRLSQWYELCGRTKNMVVSAMVLPVLVLTMAAFVIPFKSWFMGEIDGVGYLLEAAKPMAVLFVPLGLIWAIVRFTPRTGVLRKLVDGLSLKIPLVGKAAKQLALSRFFRAFHTLFKAGVEVIRCVEMSADGAGNAVVRDWLLPGAQSAREGHLVSDGFGKAFPKDYLDIWQMGEESGKLEEVTERLARISTEKAEWLIAQIAKWLPKLVYAIIAIWMIKMVFTMWSKIYPLF